MFKYLLNKQYKSRAVNRIILRSLHLFYMIPPPSYIFFYIRLSYLNSLYFMERVLWYFNFTILYWPALFYNTIFFIALYHTTLHFTLLYHTKLQHGMKDYSSLACAVLYYTKQRQYLVLCLFHIVILLGHYLQPSQEKCQIRLRAVVHLCFWRFYLFDSFWDQP